MQDHYSYWICPFSCEATFDSVREHHQHLKSKHPEDLDDDTMSVISPSCVRQSAMQSVQCPFCGEEKSGRSAWFSHVGHHLESLALFALPMNLLAEGSDNEPEPGNELAGELSSASVVSRDEESDPESEPDGDDSAPISADVENVGGIPDFQRASEVLDHYVGEISASNTVEEAPKAEEDTQGITGELAAELDQPDNFFEDPVEEGVDTSKRGGWGAPIAQMSNSILPSPERSAATTSLAPKPRKIIKSMRGWW
jgi:hypothetical protein